MTPTHPPHGPEITVQELRYLDACADQVERFKEIFGNSAALTDENWARAVAAGLNVEWLIWKRRMTCQITFLNGTRKWFRNGWLHRNNGPAIEYADGWREWRRNGRRHRDDGPAVECPDGTCAWYRDGEQVSCFEKHNHTGQEPNS